MGCFFVKLEYFFVCYLDEGWLWCGIGGLLLVSFWLYICVFSIVIINYDCFNRLVYCVVWSFWFLCCWCEFYYFVGVIGYVFVGRLIFVISIGLLCLCCIFFLLMFSGNFCSFFWWFYCRYFVIDFWGFGCWSVGF